MSATATVPAPALGGAGPERQAWRRPAVAAVRIPAAAAAPDAACPRLAVGLLFAALALHLTVSANLLFLAGIDYAHPGGNPVTKFHPASVAIVLAFLRLVLADGAPGRNLRAMRRENPGLAAFALCMVAVMVFSTASVGPSGVAIYVESYLTAGLAAVVLRRFSAAEARALGRLVLALVLANVAIALAETALQAHLVPIYLEEQALADAPGEFRPAALFDHPLTGSAVTMVVLLTLGDLRLGRLATALSFALLALGLLDWGERSGLVVAALLLGGRAACRETLNLARRTLRPARAFGLAAAALVLPLAVAVLAGTTSIGSRLAAHGGVDGSAQARVAEWDILGLLDLRAWLFGTPIADFPGLIYKIGLTQPLTGIESFWLFALLDLGLFGFALYLAGFLRFLAHLARIASPSGRTALVALVLVASTSNSLGRKCNILVVLVACLEAGARRGASPVTGFAS